MQGGSHYRNQEAVVNVVKQLPSHQRVCHLHHSIAELQRIHEEDQRGHAQPVLPPQRVPVVTPHLDLPRQRGVQSAQACGQHLHGGSEVSRAYITLAFHYADAKHHGKQKP